MISTAVNILLFLIFLYHFVAGLFVLGPKSWLLLFGKKVYALNIPVNYEPRYEITIKFLGLMALAVSGLTAEAILMPDKRLQTFTLFILAFLFLGRAILRIALRKELADAYQLSFKRSLGNIIFNITLSFLTMILAAANL